MSSTITFINKTDVDVCVALKQIGVLHFANNIKARTGRASLKCGWVWFTVEVRSAEHPYDVWEDGVKPVLQCCKYVAVVGFALFNLFSQRSTSAKVGAAPDVFAKIFDVPLKKGSGPRSVRRHAEYMRTNRFFEIRCSDSNDNEWTLVEVEDDGHAEAQKEFTCSNGDRTPGPNFCGECGVELGHSDTAKMVTVTENAGTDEDEDEQWSDAISYLNA